MYFRAIVRLAVVWAFAFSVTVALAQSLPSLRSGATIPEYGGPATVTIKAKGASGTWFHAPWPVEYIVDVVVVGGGQVMLTLVTQDQYQALSAGRKPANQQPPLKEILVGSDSASVKLPKGDYFLAFNNQTAAPLQITYRASYLRR